MLKLKNDAWRDDVAAGRRRLYHQSSLVVKVREAKLPPPAWIMQPPPDWQTPPNGIISPLRERLITMQKQLEGTQKYINEQVQIELPISMGKSRAIIVSNTHALPAE